MSKTRNPLLLTLEIVLVIVAMTIILRDNHKNTDSISGSFGYIFKETTGANQWLVMGDERKLLNFDRENSNPKSLDLLNALDWRVLYPNSDGTKITLRGTYTPKNGKFILKDWSIAIPFQRILPEKVVTLPALHKTVTCYYLEESDFNDHFHDHDQCKISDANRFDESSYGRISLPVR